jgi:hypothetical protein
VQRCIVGSVTVRPISSLTNPIEVSIDRTSPFVDDPDGNGLLTGGPLPLAGIAPSTTDPNPVPAPAGVVLGMVGVGVLSVWRSRRSEARCDT